MIVTKDLLGTIEILTRDQSLEAGNVVWKIQANVTEADPFSSVYNLRWTIKLCKYEMETHEFFYVENLPRRRGKHKTTSPKRVVIYVLLQDTLKCLVSS